MSPQPPDAHDVTRRLIARAIAQTDARSADAYAAASQRACEQAYRDISRWVGLTGARTLLTRALARAAAEYAIVKEFRTTGDEDLRFEGIESLTDTYGSAAVTAGFEAVIGNLLDLLGRLVGRDLAARLMGDPATDEAQDEAQDERPQ